MALLTCDPLVSTSTAVQVLPGFELTVWFAVALW
jgi:hypothetical protein